jgi:uncharacterized protein (DUF362 family)
MIGLKQADAENLDQSLAALLDEVGFSPPHGKGIFIKPNVVIGTRDTGIITAPRVVEALLKYCSGFSITIGERSAVGVDTIDALERSGYVELARRYGVEIVDLSQAPRVEIPWERGVLKLPRVLFENTYVNVAKLKTHFLTTVSLCTKNQKGLLSVKDAKKFHFIDIDQAILNLGKAVKPHFNIIDGIQALEGNGPTTFGKARKVGALLAGTDLFQIDSAACALMGIDPATVKHIIPQEIPEEIRASVSEISSPFLPPSLENCLTVETVHFHNIRNCCSGCILAIDNGINWLMSEEKELWLQFLKKMSSETYNIYLGVGNNLARTAELQNLRAFGSCSAHFARQNHLPYIKGCPPFPQEILHLFELG